MAGRTLWLVCLTLVCSPAARAQTGLPGENPPQGTVAQATQSAKALLLLEEGERRVAARDFAGALEPLREGIRIALADHLHADFARVVSAHVTLAVAALRLGDDATARDALDGAVRLDPALVLPEGHPPVVQRELDRARARAAREGYGELSIPAPVGARAFVDGRPAGDVPARIFKLPLGTHYVRVETADGRLLGRAVALGAAPVVVELEQPAPVAPAPAAATQVSASPVSPQPSGLARIPWWGWAGGAAVVVTVVTVVAVGLASSASSSPTGTVVATW